MREHRAPDRDSRLALPALTGIRIIAALGAIIWHGMTFAGKIMPASQHGYLGVDFFFMLSGFVLAYVHAQEMRRPSWRLYGRFLVLRLGRIWPAYAAVLLVIGLQVALREHWWQDLASPTQQRFVLHLLMLQSWGFISPNEFNLPGWSVSAEWFVYLLFPAFVVCLVRASRLAALIAIPALVAGLALLFVATGHFGVVSNDSVSLARAVAEFAVGFLLWRLFGDAAVRQWNWTLIGTASLAAIPLLWFVAEPFSTADFCFVAVFAPLLLSLAYGQGPLAKFCAWRPVVFFGEASYSIYLVHFPIMLKMGPLLRKFSDVLPSWSIGWLGVLGTVVFSALAGIVLHVIVERPSRRWVRRRLGDT